jgi:hypothetical protein
MPRAIGQIATTANTEAAVEATIYTEQTSGAQRALKSSSVNDTNAAGTGARQVRITFYTLTADGTIAGPFIETVNLNGTTAVPTVNTNIALIEKMEIVAAGSGGVAAGTITLTVDNAGAGATIGTVSANNAGSTPREVTLADGGLGVGPARLRAYVTPANVNAQTSLASFGLVEAIGSF